MHWVTFTYEPYIGSHRLHVYINSVHVAAIHLSTLQPVLSFPDPSCGTHHAVFHVLEESNVSVALYIFWKKTPSNVPRCLWMNIRMSFYRWRLCIWYQCKELTNEKIHTFEEWPYSNTSMNRHSVLSKIQCCDTLKREDVCFLWHS